MGLFEYEWMNNIFVYEWICDTFNLLIKDSFYGDFSLKSFHLLWQWLLLFRLIVGIKLTAAFHGDHGVLFVNVAS